MTKTISLLLLVLLAACSQNSQPSLQPALDAITADSLLGEIKTLSSDEFEGRKPGIRGRGENRRVYAAGSSSRWA